MLKKTLTLTLLFASNAIAQPQEDQKSTQPDLVPQYFKINGVDKTFEERMKHYGVPGASIVVIQNRKVLWSQSYGVKSVKTKARVDRDTLFQAASISKTLTAMAALKFSQEGKLNIDEPANRYLTSWKIPTHKYSKKSPVLVKQLINHSSGLSVHGFAGYNSEEPIPSLIEVLDGASGFEQLLGSKKANSAPVVVDNLPGEKFTYSGGGYSVLQQLLSDIEHSNFEGLMEDNVLAPLNMHHSSYQQPLTGKLSLLTATGHPKTEKPLDGNYHIYPEQAAAGLWTTTQDLAKFVIDIQSSLSGDGGIILSKKTANAMTSPTTNTRVGLGFFLKGAQSKDSGYFLHDGWNEGFSSTLLGHKSDGYGVIILTNANQPSFNNEMVLSIIQKYSWLEI